MVAAHVGHLLAAVWHLSSGAPCLVINASHCQAAQDAHHADHRQNHHHHRNPPGSAPLLTSACGLGWGGDSYRAHTVLMKLSRRNRHLRRTLEVVPRPLRRAAVENSFKNMVFVFCQQFSVPFFLGWPTYLLGILSEEKYSY